MKLHFDLKNGKILLLKKMRKRKKKPIFLTPGKSNVKPSK